MNQQDVDRAVAKACGESVETIAGRGFVLLTPTPRELEPGGIEYDDLLERVTASSPSQARDFDEIESAF